MKIEILPISNQPGRLVAVVREDTTRAPCEDYALAFDCPASRFDVPALIAAAALEAERFRKHPAPPPNEAAE